MSDDMVRVAMTVDLGEAGGVLSVTFERRVPMRKPPIDVDASFDERADLLRRQEERNLDAAVIAASMAKAGAQSISAALREGSRQ